MYDSIVAVCGQSYKVGIKPFLNDLYSTTNGAAGFM